MIKTQSSIIRSWGRVFAAMGLTLAACSSVRADYKSTVLADNPLAFYDMSYYVDLSGYTNYNDLTGNGNDGNATNTTAASGPSAFLPTAAYFTGNNSYADLSYGGNYSLLNFSGPISLETWCKPSSSGEFGDIIAKGYDSSTYDEITIRVNGPYGQSYHVSSGTQGLDGGSQATNWTYVVMSSDGTNTSLYINGGLVARTGDTSGAINFGDDWVIGDGSSAGGGRFFQGDITGTAIYNYGLTPAQVQKHYLLGMYGTTNVSPRNLTWSAVNNSGSWDTGASTNWINQANSQATVFDFGDNVLFDDTPGVPTTVTVNGAVNPTSVTINASANAYTIQGGSLTGTGPFVKTGSAPLTVDVPSGFQGPVIMGGGLTYAGNNCFDAAASLTISNGATMDLGGAGFSKPTPVTIAGFGTSGQGALISSYSDYPGENFAITMTGDTKFGGSARFDLANGSSVSGAHNLILDWSGGAGYSQWNSTIVGATVAGIFVTNASTLGTSGMDNSCQNPATLFTFEPGSQMIDYGGGFNGSVHAMAGVQVDLYTAPYPFNGSSWTFETNTSLVSYYGGGNNTFAGTITLNGVVHFVVGDHMMVYSNVVSGPGGFVLDYYNNGVQFYSANTYTGPTIIGSGGNSPEVVLTGNGSVSHSSLLFMGGNDSTVTRFDVSGRSDGTLTLAGGQTLQGIGAINGALVVSSTATISPAGTNTTIASSISPAGTPVAITTGANATGTIAVSGSVTLNGATVIKLNGSGVNDQISGASIAYSGTLNLQNISGSALAAGNSFQIFNAPSISGSFSGFSPSTPGAGLKWDFSNLNTTGFIGVVAVPQPNITTVSLSAGGSSLVLSGSGGADNATFYVLTSTNVGAPLMNWTRLSTNTFSATGTFNVTNAVSGGAQQQYYLIDQSQ
jgi:hypothetical protein